MWNFLEVVGGTCILAWILFVWRPNAGKILSASRWMILSWGVLYLVHCFSPITFSLMKTTWRVWLYSIIWVGVFVFADNVRITFGSGTRHRFLSPQRLFFPVRILRGCAWLSIAGAALLLYHSGDAVMSSNASSVIANLRNIQLGGDDSGLLKTIATLLACSGLVVALIEVCQAILASTSISVRAGASLLAYLGVTILTGGRPGFVLASVSLFVAIVASILLTGREFVTFRKVVVSGALIACISIGYIMFVVSTRTVGFIGGMDNKIAAVNGLISTELDPNFRESLRSFGAIGDTIIEGFYYLGTQFGGMDYSLQHFDGPFGDGLTEIPFITRRLESVSGIAIMDPVFDAHNRMFERIGVFPHFFETAAESTFLDFGTFLSIPFVFACGVLSRRGRTRALQSRTAFSISMQALICSGAAWTIIMSPFQEQSWAFPLLWFLLIEAAQRVRDFGLGEHRAYCSC